MDSQNIKVYLAISGALIVLLILVLIIPFAKKSPTTNNLQPTTSVPIPTTVQTRQQPIVKDQQLTPIPADFTGAADEPIPQQIVDFAAQKKDLQLKVPLNLSNFSIDFDYSEDKFIVSFKDPKDQAQKDFETWRESNYPALRADQFLFRQ